MARLLPLLFLLLGTGGVDSPRTASLTAALQADVEQAPARAGTAVTAGAVLVRLDDRDASPRLAQREADASGLRAENANEAQRDEPGRTRLPVRGVELGDGRAIITTQLPNPMNGLVVRAAP